MALCLRLPVHQSACTVWGQLDLLYSTSMYILYWSILFMMYLWCLATLINVLPEAWCSCLDGVCHHWARTWNGPGQPSDFHGFFLRHQIKVGNMRAKQRLDEIGAFAENSLSWQFGKTAFLQSGWRGLQQGYSTRLPGIAWLALFLLIEDTYGKYGPFNR